MCPVNTAAQPLTSLYPCRPPSLNEKKEAQMEHRRWVSRYRDELKGIAILWVVLFHMRSPLPGLLGEVQKMGYGGVDIFLFLTGYGLYHSLQKSNELGGYMHRRLWRVLPAYVPFILCWMLLMFPGYGLSATQAIRGVAGNLFMVGFWFQTPKVFNWYVSAFFLLMLLAPVLHGLLSRSGKQLRTLLGLLATAFLLGLCCIGDDRYMGVSRLPVFILGMAYAMDWRPQVGPAVKRGLYALAFVLGLAALFACFARYPELLNDYAMYWHPFVLMTPGLCVGLAFLLHKADRARGLFAPLRFFGRASFEIYLVNIWVVEVATRRGVKDVGPWLLMGLGCLLAGGLYHLLVNAAVAGVKKRCLPSGQSAKADG